MRRFIGVFRAGFLYLWSDPASAIMLTLFPIVLILVLGTALNSLVAGDNTIAPVPCAYVGPEDGGLYRFLTEGETARYLSLTPCSPEEAETLLKERTVSCIIREENGQVDVTRAGGSEGYAVALNIVEVYRGIGAAAELAVRDGRNPAQSLSVAVAVQTAETGGRVPGSIDYYATTMQVMILLYTGMNAMSLFAKNTTGEFGRRLQAAPVRRGVLVGGSVAAATAVSFLQGMITFVFTGAVYGVYWGERVPLVLLTLFVLTVFSQMLCIFVTLAVRNEGAAVGILQILFWVFTFVSKGYVKVDFGKADEVFRYAPNALAQTVIFGAVYGGEETVMAQSLLILFAMTAALAAGAYLLGRRRTA